MKAIWVAVCMLFAPQSEYGHVTASELHKAMDVAIANGWQPALEAKP